MGINLQWMGCGNNGKTQPNPYQFCNSIVCWKSNTYTVYPEVNWNLAGQTRGRWAQMNRKGNFVRERNGRGAHRGGYKTKRAPRGGRGEKQAKKTCSTDSQRLPVDPKVSSLGDWEYQTRERGGKPDWNRLSRLKIVKKYCEACSNLDGWISGLQGRPFGRKGSDYSHNKSVLSPGLP